MIDNLVKGLVCRVVCGDESGTGFLVLKAIVLTARHCVLPAVTHQKPIMLEFISETGPKALEARVIAHSEDLDACILALDQDFNVSLLTLDAGLPREGSQWRSFAYPLGKAQIGHRLVGTVDHVLPTPQAKCDMDLTVETGSSLANYRGCSGGPVVVDGSVVGMLRFRFGESLGGISLHTLYPFLKAHAPIPEQEEVKTEAPPLASRAEFQRHLEDVVVNDPGRYLFIQGGHGLGKTTFCSSYSPADPSLVLVGAYCVFLPGTPLGVVHRAQPAIFFDWLSTSAANLVTGKGARREDLSYLKMAEQTGKILDAISRHADASKKTAVLFIDGLNEANDADPALLTNLLGLLPAKLPPRLTIVMTAPNFSQLAPKLAPWVKAENVLTLPPLAMAASGDYCRQRLLPSHVNPGLVQTLCDKAAGHPLYLHYLIEYVNSHPGEVVLDEFLPLSGPIENYYQAIWGKLADDAQASFLLALIARLRWGVELEYFSMVLSGPELAGLTATLRKVHHLLADDKTTSIYHQSFAAFIISQTNLVHQHSHDRLAALCRTESRIRYGHLNLVYHLCRGSTESQLAAIAACDQRWADDAVLLAAEPDSVLQDLRDVLEICIERGPTTEFFRLQLLLQRIEFRYNVLLSQSASLIAEALITLRRPEEALTYVVRYRTLIINPEEALRVAHRMIEGGNNAHAFRLLKLLIESLQQHYARGVSLQELLRFASLNIQALFQARRAGGRKPIKQVMAVLKYAQEGCDELLKDQPGRSDEFMESLRCLYDSYCLAFRERVGPIAELKNRLNGHPVPPVALSLRCRSLFAFESQVDLFVLSKRRPGLPSFYTDLDELLELKQTLPQGNVLFLLDSLVRFGAPARLVQAVSTLAPSRPVRPIQIIGPNGVDVDLDRLEEDMNRLRTAAYLEEDSNPPPDGPDDTAWSSSLERLAQMLFWCDGRARKAHSDGNSSAVDEVWWHLQSGVLDPLVPTLARRVSWTNSFSVPEQLLPYLHRHVVELLVDCFPHRLSSHLELLISRASDQWGMYSEGYRESCHRVVGELLREERSPEIDALILKILSGWRSHVFVGVENRRELVPEILRIVPFYVKLGAHEEAARLYTTMLEYTMGPSWYKEEQLDVMVSTLESYPLTDDVASALPLVAGYLQRASGEMTFQRYVRSAKTRLIGELVRRGLVGPAIQYFRGQSCGSHERLIAESRAGLIDKPYPERGGRFPGGALDEQDAILQIVQKSTGADWRLRWSLLEVFLCGESRHLEEYAIAFAALVNENRDRQHYLPSFVYRLTVALFAETSPELQGSFRAAFRTHLRQELLPHFGNLLNPPPGELIEDDRTTPHDAPPVNADDVKEEAEREFLAPGFIGRRSGLADADRRLQAAEADAKIGNHREAKKGAATALRSLQRADWNIWTNAFSDEHTRLEAILREGEKGADTLLRHYGLIIKEEKNAPPWIVAQHLIQKTTDLLSPTERRKILDEVIQHVRSMVGDSPSEVRDHGFLALGAAPGNTDSELTELLFWLVDHPVALRRERAASMIAWLAENLPTFLPAMASRAFSNAAGLLRDALAAILDRVSRRQTDSTWDLISQSIDLNSLLSGSVHVSRIEILRRIAERAEHAGSVTAKGARLKIEQFLSRLAPPAGRTSLKGKPPLWAQCRAWKDVESLGLASVELLKAFRSELDQICAPCDTKEVWAVEALLSDGFREARNKPQDRWSALQHSALNRALSSFVGLGGLRSVEAALRDFNPEVPDAFLQPGKSATLARLWTAMESDSYENAFIDEGLLLLHLKSTFVTPKNDIAGVEVVAVMVSASTRTRAAFPPRLASSFKSSQLPDEAPHGEALETCSRLKLENVLFGAFTPSAPLPQFISRAGCSPSDFIRQTWRFGRQRKLSHFGLPVEEGSLLQVKHASLKLPDGQKLAWIVWVNGQLMVMVDEHDNRLL